MDPVFQQARKHVRLTATLNLSTCSRAIVLLAIVGIVLYSVLFSTTPAIHDLFHELRHTRGHDHHVGAGGRGRGANGGGAHSVMRVALAATFIVFLYYTLREQSLLTAIQTRELAITGRSAGSSGSMVRSEPAPCEFLMILAGNIEDIEKMHPALRSRIRGYGYEIFTQSVMDDSPANRLKLVQFIAQEVRRDGKIPHFSRGGIEAILDEACLRAGQAGRLTTGFRELGGLVRIAGDLAIQDASRLVHGDHVRRARTYALTLEEQHLRQSQIQQSGKTE